jgi:tetratricopeptide (TPR) repeat protein
MDEFPSPFLMRNLSSDIGRPHTSLLSQNASLIAFFGLLVLLFISHIYPQQAYPLHSIFVVGCMFLVLLVVLVHALWQSRLSRSQVLLLASYFLFLCWTLVATARAPIISEANPIAVSFLEGLWVLTIGALVFTSNAASPSGSLNPLRLLTQFFVIAALLLSLYALYQYGWGFSRLYEQLKWQEQFLGMDRIEWGILHALKEKRVFATFGNSNVFGGFLAIAFPFLLASVAVQRRTWLKCALLAQIALMCVVIYLTKSRGAFLCAGLAIILTLVMLNRQLLLRNVKIIRIVFFIAIILVLLFAGLLVRSAAKARSGDVHQSSLARRLTNLTTVRERLFYLQIGFRMIPRAPLLGSGLGAYGVLYPQYRLPQAQESKYVHNFVAQLWIETGLIGLIVFLIFAIGVFLHGIKTYRTVEDKSEDALLAALLVAYVIFLINGLIEYTFYVREIFLDWCLLGGAIIGSRGMREERTAAMARNQIVIERSPEATHGTYAVARIPIFVLSLTPLLFFPSFLIRPAMAYFYAYHGDQAVREGDKARALRYYRHAYAWDPANSLYGARLGRTQFDLGQFELGITKMKRAIELNPYSASLRDELAQAYRRIGEFRQAIYYQQQAVRCYPLHPLYHYHLSLLYEEIGDLDGALQEAEQALRIDSPFRAVYKDHLERLREKVKVGRDKDESSPA